MSAKASKLVSATRPVDPGLAKLVLSLQPGARIRVRQTIRVGRKEWTTTVAGVFRGVNYLDTGLSTHRVPEDDIVVPIVHFTKDNGELSSVTLDEHTVIDRV